MEGSEFKARLRLLGRTQTQFADEIGRTRRTVSDWARHGAPAEIAYLMDLITVSETPFGCGRQDEHIIAALDDAMHRAKRDGSGMDVLRSVHRWLKAHLPDARPGRLAVDECDEISEMVDQDKIIK